MKQAVKRKQNKKQNQNKETNKQTNKKTDKYVNKWIKSDGTCIFLTSLAWPTGACFAFPVFTFSSKNVHRIDKFIFFR